MEAGSSIGAAASCGTDAQRAHAHSAHTATNMRVAVAILIRIRLCFITTITLFPLAGWTVHLDRRDACMPASEVPYQIKWLPIHVFVIKVARFVLVTACRSIFDEEA